MRHYKWNDAEGEFTVDLDSGRWALKGIGTLIEAVASKTPTSPVIKQIGDDAGFITQTWTFDGRLYFHGFTDRFIPGSTVRRFVITGSIVESQDGIGGGQGSVAIYAGTSLQIVVAGYLEYPLSGAEVSGSGNTFSTVSVSSSR